MTPQGDLGPPPAFVAGATGYTGREVVRELRRREIPTVAHVRPDSPRLREWYDRFGRIGAAVNETAWERHALATALRELRPALLFILLGTTRARAKAAKAAANSQESYASVDYGLTAMLVAAAADAATRPRVLYLSSAGVRADTTNQYLYQRWRAEEAVRTSGLPWTIVRASFITGSGRDERRPAERAAAMVADAALGAAALLGARALRARYRSITAPQLAAALVRLALDPDAENTVVYGEGLR